MATKPVSRQKVEKTTSKKTQVCTKCGKKNEFYASRSSLYSYYGTLPICKECLVDIYAEYYRRFQDNEKCIIEICKLLNLCFNDKIFQNAKDALELQGIEIISGYMKYYNLSKLPKDATFFDSTHFEVNANVVSVKIKETPKDDIDKDMDIPLTDEEQLETWKDLFGAKGYEIEEYVEMGKKYDSLMNNYNAPTSMHVEALVTYVKYKCKEEKSIASGDVDSAKKWGELASKAATAAKLNPSQMSQSDLQGGLNTVSDIFKAVEQAKDIVSILPEFKARPKDSLDFVIWCFVNYERELSGMARCTYSDIYKYYDDRVADYIENSGDPYGLFEQDYSKENRENIYKHISDIENRDGTFVKSIEEGGEDG